MSLLTTGRRLVLLLVAWALLVLLRILARSVSCLTILLTRVGLRRQKPTEQIDDPRIGNSKQPGLCSLVRSLVRSLVCSLVCFTSVFTSVFH